MNLRFAGSWLSVFAPQPTAKERKKMRYAANRAAREEFARNNPGVNMGPGHDHFQAPSGRKHRRAENILKKYGDRATHPGALKLREAEQKREYDFYFNRSSSNGSPYYDRDAQSDGSFGDSD